MLVRGMLIPLERGCVVHLLSRVRMDLFSRSLELAFTSEGIDEEPIPYKTGSKVHSPRGGCVTIAIGHFTLYRKHDREIRFKYGLMSRASYVRFREYVDDISISTRRYCLIAHSTRLSSAAMKASGAYSERRNLSVSHADVVVMCEVSDHDVNVLASTPRSLDCWKGVPPCWVLERGLVDADDVCECEETIPLLID
ncbi:hypothetical protein Tco_1152532 [Tanacetum coccineum]